MYNLVVYSDTDTQIINSSRLPQWLAYWQVLATLLRTKVTFMFALCLETA